MSDCSYGQRKSATYVSPRKLCFARCGSPVLPVCVVRSEPADIEAFALHPGSLIFTGIVSASLNASRPQFLQSSNKGARRPPHLVCGVLRDQARELPRIAHAALKFISMFITKSVDQVHHFLWIC